MLCSKYGSVASGLLHETLVAAGEHCNPSNADVAVNFHFPNLAPIMSGNGAHTWDGLQPAPGPVADCLPACWGCGCPCGWPPYAVCCDSSSGMRMMLLALPLACWIPAPLWLA